MQNIVLQHFTQQFGELPHWIVRAPGRVNLIGEHTDYNAGFVLPMAIDRAVWVALRPRSDRRVALFSADFDTPAEFSLDSLQNEQSGWAEYPKGMAWALSQAGYTLRGWEGVLTSDVPIGAGLSSSAALELAVARSCAVAADLPWHPAQIALLAQKADNQFVGVNSGIMDQMISACGKAGNALLIDCRDLSTQCATLPAGTAVLVLDTATRRGLVKSAYNDRVNECQRAARHYAVPALRDLASADLLAGRTDLDETAFRRARHVVSENERTLQAVEAMHQQDALKLGALMDASHASLRNDYEVSCFELDTMVELTRKQAGCYGARMTGAGFGGCAVALVDAERAPSIIEAVTPAYQQATGKTPRIYQCQPTNGAEVVWQAGA
ncbi:MAG TPA: galactokinase [Anaerolineales bacterium]|nr:galactokinase [Anaerolineales bacterium]